MNDFIGMVQMWGYLVMMGVSFSIGGFFMQKFLSKVFGANK